MSRMDVGQDVLKSRQMARALVLLLVALASFTLAVTASADPPDPTWIAGFWDDDDQDNAIIAILAIRGVVASASLSLPTFLAIQPLLVAPPETGIAISVCSDIEPRAPPPAPQHLL